MVRQAGLREAIDDTRHEYCHACHAGDYPTELVNIGQLMQSKGRRG